MDPLRAPVPRDGTAPDLPEPADWLAITLRRRVVLVGALLGISAVFFLLDIGLPVGVFVLLALHLATAIGARELVARRPDGETRRRLFAAMLAAECWVVTIVSHLVGGTRWLGASGLLVQILLPTFALERRQAAFVTANAIVAWTSVVLAETLGLVVPPAFPGLPADRAHQWVVFAASAVVSALFIAYATTSVAQFRQMIFTSARRLAEREASYRATLAALRDVVFRVDGDGRWTFLSPPWESLTGQPVDAAIGRRADAAFHPDDQPAVRTALGLGGEAPPSVPEVRLRGPDGGWRTVELRARADGGSGAPTTVTGTIADVTERAALRDQAEQVARLEAIGRLAGGVAHDVNNVLTTIQVQADALDQTLPRLAREELRPIHEAVARGALLTRQLLSFGRRQQVTPALLDVASTMRSLEGLLQRMAGPDLRLVVDASTPAWTRADARQLEQVVGCFVANARDASASGADVRVEVEALEATEPVPPPTIGRIGAMARHVAGDAVPVGRWAVVRVRDEGVGIDEDAVPRLFEPFFTTRGEGRTGLGLAAVYGAVRQAQGIVRLASTPGVGTTAEVFLPAVDAPAVLPAGSTGAPAAPPGTRVLLVEDEHTLRFAVRRMLERRGYFVVEAANGRDALAALETGALPDVVITDVVMPELDGRAFVREAEARWPGLRVLFISGYTAAEAGHAGTVLDGRPLLQKPFTAPALYAAVDALMAQR